MLAGSVATLNNKFLEFIAPDDIVKSLAKVVAPKLLEFPAAVILAEKVPVDAANAPIVVFPKLFELPLALMLAEKVALVPNKLPPTVKFIPVSVEVAPSKTPPAIGKYGPPITVEASTQVGAALPFDLNICPEVP